MSREISVTLGETDFQETVTIGKHQILMDSEEDTGGQDKGPSPHDLLTASLISCKSMTMRMYAKRKGWEVKGMKVRATQVRVDRNLTRFEVFIELPFHLNVEQKERLIEISKKCPVHRILAGQVEIETKEVSS